jgi:tRNA 2-selenouridine synthase
MPETLDTESFLNRSSRVAVVDVRSPGEFTQGHIPGAVSVPLFSDAERAEIGTTYVQQGRKPAVMLGLACVGSRMAELGARLTELADASGGEVLIHCWRGGMRSASVAWLAETLDIRAATLVGGYKSFRRWAIDTTGRGRAINVVAGLTGTGKTHVIHALAARGENVLDLEKLAHHKGSAFGDLGEEAQPTQEQFENELAMAWRDTRADAPVWLEDESRNIGRCSLPDALWQSKQAGHFHVIELPDEVRLAHLCEVYSGHPPEVLAARIECIRKRLGGDRTSAAIEAVCAGDFESACKLVLAYYDRTYREAIDKLPPDRVEWFHFFHLDPTAIAEALCASSHPVLPSFQRSIIP